MDPETPQPVTTTRPERSISSLVLHLVLSLLFAAAMSQLVIFNYDTTVEVWVTWMVAWGVMWLVFAALQVRWWARGNEKFWRPIYAWTLFGHIVLSLILLPLLLWSRFRTWLFRVMKPTDPPSSALEGSLRALVHLRDEGLITPEEFETKRAEILGRA